MPLVKGDGSVRFRFFRPSVARVSVAGDFNEWRDGPLAMRPDNEAGWWIAETKLDPGEYRFRYVADGRWFTDFAAHGVEPAPGGWNGVLVVPEAAGSAELSRID